MTNKQRAERITAQLNHIEPVIGGWYCSNPDGQARRWVFGSRAYTTSEVEAYLEGWQRAAEAAQTDSSLRVFA